MYLTPDQRRRIDHVARIEGATLAEVIRRALDAYLADEPVDVGTALEYGMNLATRVLVTVILDALAAGLTPEQITQHYPTIDVDDVRAAPRTEPGSPSRRSTRCRSPRERQAG